VQLQHRDHELVLSTVRNADPYACLTAGCWRSTLSLERRDVMPPVLIISFKRPEALPRRRHEASIRRVNIAVMSKAGALPGPL